MTAATIAEPLNVAAVRADFPILATKVRGLPLAYLDNGASSQKSASVIEAMDWYSRNANANTIEASINSANFQPSYMKLGARRPRLLLNAAEPSEIVLTKGCTEAINLVAAAWGSANLKPGDVVAISELEHHSNIVPWQLVAERTGATIGVIPIDDRGVLDMAAYADLLKKGNVKMVAVTHVSNVLGTVSPICEMAEVAHRIRFADPR